jgi:uncharacterized OsmC-like protein
VNSFHQPNKGAFHGYQNEEPGNARRQRHQCQRSVCPDRGRQAGHRKSQNELARHHNLAGPNAEPFASEIGGEEVPRRFSIDIDEPCELGGTNRFANPQEHLIAALNACMTVGYVAQCAVRGIILESLEIETDGEIDLRGFLGIDSAVPTGYENLAYVVRIKGSGTNEEFAEIHEAVMATSPNFYNMSRPVALKPTLVVD